MSIQIREVTNTDWDFILKIRNQKNSLVDFHDTSSVSSETHYEYMKKLRMDPKTFQWIIVFEGKDVGYIKIIGTELGSNMLDGFRRKGIGTNAYKLVFEEARKKGLKKLTATVKINRTTSLDFETKLGWVKKNIIYKNGDPYSIYIEKELI